ncbi:MAG: hypothetical protein ACREN6_02650, partial [Gemmatimonadaceae bacterium]
MSSAFSDTTVEGAIQSVPSLARVIHDSLDAEGSLLINTRASAPDIGGNTTQQTTFSYDAAHRRRTREEQNSSSDSTVYDPAGNPVQEITARQKTIRQTYDALNRLAMRTLPGDTTAQEICTGCTNNVGLTLARFPYWPTVLPGGSTSADLIIQPDTARFTYDAAGHMLTAINHDAQVWKSYFANGAVHVERDTLRVYDPADTMSYQWGYEHWYTRTYAYDLSGRRTIRTDSIAGAGGGAQTYHYNALGLLDSTTAWGIANAFQYDASGRLIHRATGTGVFESRTYDDDDDLTSRTNNTYNDGMSYDARGKITGFSTSISPVMPGGGSRINSYSTESSSMRYDGFGGLVEVDQDRGSPVADEYMLDALGNLLRHDQNR